MAVEDGSNVEILVIGAGSTGLMTGLWMAELGIKTCIVDNKGTRALNGRCDGFHDRTSKIFDSFGLYSVLQQHGTPFDEWCMWAPGDDRKLSRQRRQTMMGLEVSRMNSYTFHQGNTEAALIDAIQQRHGSNVRRGVVPIALHLDETLTDDPEAYPVKVQLRHLARNELVEWGTNAHSVQSDGSIHPERGFVESVVRSTSTVDDTTPVLSGEEGSIKTIHAKYVVDFEGAHSWVRRQLGFQMEGASSNAVWGVIDALPQTLHHPHPAWDYPERSTRERHDAIEASITSPEMGAEIMAVARQSLFPYVLEYTYCDWWTIYRVGQRVADHFAYQDRIFLDGDAVYTHTPKGGQRMNVSMQDAFNLGWKLAGVIRGQLQRSNLQTYESERRPVAQDLINLDTNMAGVLASDTMSDPIQVRAVYDQLRNYGSGANICSASWYQVTQQNSFWLQS